jgi:type 2 lantibiotic biosynthesis protein LanM
MLRPVEETVLASGLLPQRIWNDDGEGGIDISGLGARSGRTTPSAYPQIVDAGTDRLRLEPRKSITRDPHSAPRLGEQEVALQDHLDDLLAGFAGCHRLLRRWRSELLADGGPIAAFARAPVRILARPTHTYASLLDAAAHPHYQRDGLDRQRLFDRLWSAVRERPYLARLVEHEQCALGGGDVPHFTTTPASCDLVTADGITVPGFFAVDGMTRVRRRLEQLDDRDLVTQGRIISGTVTAAALHLTRPETPRLPRQAKEPPSRERLLAAAVVIGERLEELAIVIDEQRFWLAAHPVGRGGHWSYDTVGFDLYHGHAGIGLFLAHLAEVTGEDRFRRSARSALLPVAASLSAAPRQVADVGAMTGWGGMILLWLHLAKVWGDVSWLAPAMSAVREIDRMLADDRVFDVMGGAAGALLALIRLGRVTGSDEALALAHRCGEHLLANAQPMASGLGWLTSSAPPALGGLSHGAAGIAWALAEATTATGDSRFADAAAAAHAYQDSLFDPVRCNWRDLRPANQAGEQIHGDGHGCGWCHGAGGIALARWLASSHLDAADRATARRDVVIAAEALRSRPDLGDHSLCHGEVGNLLMLQAFAIATGDDGSTGQVGGLAGGLLDSLDTHGTRCGWGCGVELPGLMCGLAGVGYGLLRLAVPEQVPNVLALEIPR